MKELISILLACQKTLAAAWERADCKSQQYWTDWLKWILRLLITLILTESGDITHYVVPAQINI